MVLPSTKLGYTLGIKRDRDIISPRETFQIKFIARNTGEGPPQNLTITPKLENNDEIAASSISRLNDIKFI